MMMMLIPSLLVQHFPEGVGEIWAASRRRGTLFCNLGKTPLSSNFLSENLTTLRQERAGFPSVCSNFHNAAKLGMLAAFQTFLMLHAAASLFPRLISSRCTSITVRTSLTPLSSSWNTPGPTSTWVISTAFGCPHKQTVDFHVLFSLFLFSSRSSNSCDLASADWKKRRWTLVTLFCL